MHWYELLLQLPKSLRVRQSLESCTSWKNIGGVDGPASKFYSLPTHPDRGRRPFLLASFSLHVVAFFLCDRAELEERERGRERHVERLLQERGEFYSLVLVSINRKIALQNGLWKRLKTNHRTN